MILNIDKLTHLLELPYIILIYAILYFQKYIY